MSDRTLPPNWRSAKDSDGKEYYFNELTGDTSWEFPEGGDEKPIPAAMSPATNMAVGAADESEFAPAEAPPTLVGTTPMGGSSGGGLGLDMSGISGVLGDGVLPRILILCFCSLVVLVSSAVALGNAGALVVVGPDATVVSKSNGSTEAYGVAVGSVSLGFSVILLLVAKKKPSLYSNWTLPKVRGELSMLQCYAAFLVAWWAPAAIVLTFFNPFTATSNAYFAIWAAFVLSLLMLSASFARVGRAFTSMTAMQEDARVRPIIGLTITSAIVLFSCIEGVGEGKGAATYGLIAAIFSTLLSALLFYMVDRKKAGIKLKKLAAIFFLLLWIATAIVLTFHGPFTVTGNGYFATWASLGCAFLFVFQEFIGGDMGMSSQFRRSFSFAPMRDEEMSSTKEVV